MNIDNLKPCLKSWLPDEVDEIVLRPSLEKETVLRCSEGIGSKTEMRSWGWHAETGFSELHGDSLISGRQLFYKNGLLLSFVVRETKTRKFTGYHVKYEIFRVTPSISTWRRVEDMVDAL